MPFIIDHTAAGGTVDLPDQGYTYPGGLNLAPGQALHSRLVAELTRRARESAAIMQQRHHSWREIDRTLTAYISPEENELRRENKIHPVVIPLSYATLETLLTYMVKAFLDDPIFRYVGVGPEDTVGAILLEHVINQHCLRFKVGLGLHTMWRDALAYGFGVAACAWKREWGWTTTQQTNGSYTPLGQFVPTEVVNVRQEVVRYEGNTLVNIDPYRYLPDPSVPIHDVQAGDFVGWVERTSYVGLLARERDGSEELFNVRYLKGKGDCRSTIVRRSDSGRDRFGTDTQYRSTTTQVVDVLNLYAKIIPADWGLSDSDYPEIWQFAVAGDQVLVQARPLGLDHGRFPLVVCAPDTDGYSITPVSRLEVVYGLQEVADFLFTSHVSNVKKALNDMLLVDPSQVNMEDLLDPRPGKVIRMRRSAWGKGVNDAIKQLAVADVTTNHVQDANIIADLIQRVTGATDALQGIQKSKSGERRSAAEFQGTSMMAVSRLEKIARIGSLQAMQDIAYYFGCHTQQLISAPTWIKTIGRWADSLTQEFGPVDRVLVDPRAIDVAFDIEPHDGTTASPGNADAWKDLYQIALQSQNPELLSRLDFVRIFLHIARQMGTKNVTEFMKTPQQMMQSQLQIAPDQQVLAQAQAGNLVPMMPQSLPPSGAA